MDWQKVMDSLWKAFRPKWRIKVTSAIFLILYRNTRLHNGLYLPVKLLCARQAISHLPISHVARMQVETSCRYQTKSWQTTRQGSKANQQEPSTGYHKLVVISNVCYVKDATKQAMVSRDNHKCTSKYFGLYMIIASDEAVYRCVR